MDADDDLDCDGMEKYRRRNADLDELLRIAAEQLREAQRQIKARKSEPVIGDELRLLPAHPRFTRYVNKLSDKDREDWINRMRQRYGEDF